MRKQDKRKPKPKGVWVELAEDGNVWIVPVRMTRHRAVSLMQQAVQSLENVRGMTKQ